MCIYIYYDVGKKKPTEKKPGTKSGQSGIGETAKKVGSRTKWDKVKCERGAENAQRHGTKQDKAEDKAGTKSSGQRRTNLEDKEPQFQSHSPSVFVVLVPVPLPRPGKILLVRGRFSSTGIRSGKILLVRGKILLVQGRLVGHLTKNRVGRLGGGMVGLGGGTK